MKTAPRAFFIWLLLSIVGLAAGEPERWKLTVGEVEREALVYAPATAKTAPAPLVFVFHGHGGRSEGAIRSFSLNTRWPEAISVYMQGLNTPGRLTDPDGKKPGWQGRAGDQGDRDLKFFDAMLERLRKEYQVDSSRIYCTGHSNGGGFTYLLWAERGDVFAAMAPSSAVARESMPKLKPKPALHSAGQTDPLVKYAWQAQAIAAVKKLNGCAEEGKPWGTNATWYDSKTGNPFVTYIHPGGHQFPDEAAETIARFFKEQAKK